MSASDDRVMLVTVRMRCDPDHPGAMFVALHRYGLTDDGDDSGTAVESGSIEDAIWRVRTWMEEFLSAQPWTRESR